jgi:hypothetical protein
MTNPLDSIRLYFVRNSTGQEAPSLTIDPEALMEALTLRGATKMKVNWLDFFESEHFVNDDAAFIVESWLEADQNGSANSRHSVVLGDGLIMLEAVTVDELTTLTIVYTPYLNSAFSERESAVLSSSEYRSAWAGLVWQLLDVINDMSEGVLAPARGPFEVAFFDKTGRTRQGDGRAGRSEHLPALRRRRV